MLIKDIRDNFTFRMQCATLGVDYRNSIAFKNVVLVFKPDINRYVVLDEEFNYVGIDDLHAENPKFKLVCKKYGLDNYNYYLFGNVIALCTPVKNVYVLVDKNYNVFSVTKCKQDNLKETVLKLYNSYVDESVLYKTPLSHILMAFTLENVLCIARRLGNIKYIGNNKEMVSITIDEYTFIVNASNIKVQLLSLIKYLEECAEFLFNQSYSLLVMKMITNSPDVKEYLQKVMFIISKTTLENQFDAKIHLNLLIDKLGQMTKREEFSILLEEIVNFINVCHNINDSTLQDVNREDLKFAVNQIMRLAESVNGSSAHPNFSTINSEDDFEDYFSSLDLVKNKKYYIKKDTSDSLLS